MANMGNPRHLANVGFSNFRYTDNDQSNCSTEGHQQEKWTRTDNNNMLHGYLKSNPTQSFLKSQGLFSVFWLILKMLSFSDFQILIEKLWLKFGQNLLDLIQQTKVLLTMLEWYFFFKVWFPDLDILEKCEQVNRGGILIDPLTRIEAVNTEKHLPFTQIETQNTANHRPQTLEPQTNVNTHTHTHTQKK